MSPSHIYSDTTDTTRSRRARLARAWGLTRAIFITRGIKWITRTDYCVVQAASNAQSIQRLSCPCTRYAMNVLK